MSKDMKKRVKIKELEKIFGYKFQEVDNIFDDVFKRRRACYMLKDEKIIGLGIASRGYANSQEYIKNISILEELHDLEYINFEHSKISDLSSLKNLKKLKKINLSQNMIKDISPLKDLENLEYLDLRDNRISDLSSLKNLKNLNFLNLSSNTNISEFSPLKDLKKLETLYLNYNYIRDFSNLNGLNDLVNLKNLYLNNNGIKNFSPLKNLKSLEKLSLANNDITEVSSLKNLINLKELDLSDRSNTISDLSSLINLKELTTIKLNLKDSDLHILKIFKKLTKIDMWQNTVDDLSFLDDLKMIKEIRFSKLETNNSSVFKKLEDLESIELYSAIFDFSYLKDLKKLEKINFGVSVNTESRDLSFLKDMKNLKELKLGEFYLGYTSGVNKKLDLLPLKNLNNLEIIKINSNITDISPLKDLENLKEINFYKTNISDISPLKNLKKLKKIEITDNIDDKISDISPLKNLKNLETIDFTNNNIKDITFLSELKNLKYINLEKNKISDISPLKNLKKIVSVTFYKNKKLDEIIGYHDFLIFSELKEYIQKIELKKAYNDIVLGDIYLFEKSFKILKENNETPEKLYMDSLISYLNNFPTLIEYNLFNDLNKKIEFKNIEKKFNIDNKILNIELINHKKFKFIYSDGTVIKSFPKTVDDNIKDEFKEFKKLLKKDYKFMMEILELSMLSNGRAIHTLQLLKEYIFTSNIFKDISQTILWGEYSLKEIDEYKNTPFKYYFYNDKPIQLFFPLEDGTFVDLNGDDIKFNNNNLIKPIHPLELTKDEMKKSKEFIKDYEIKQIFTQIERIIYLSDSEKNYFDDFEGITLTSTALRKRVGKKWNYGAVRAHGIFYYYSKIYYIPNGELHITLNFSGHHIRAKLNKQNSIKIGRIEFNKSFKDIPKIVLSEIYKELTELLF